jgi:S-DNA-T family DNA segregation ATPase FtsK/SpoIIIE
VKPEPFARKLTPRKIEPETSFLSSLKPAAAAMPAVGDGYGGAEPSPARTFNESDGTFRQGLNTDPYRPFSFDAPAAPTPRLDPKIYGGAPDESDGFEEPFADGRGDFLTRGEPDAEEIFTAPRAVFTEDAEDGGGETTEAETFAVPENRVPDSILSDQTSERIGGRPESRAFGDAFGKAFDEPEEQEKEIGPLAGFAGGDTTGYYETLRPEKSPREEFEDKIRRIDAALSGVPEAQPESGFETRAVKPPPARVSRLKPENQFGLDEYAESASRERVERPKPLKQPVRYTPPPLDLLSTVSDDPGDDDFQSKAELIETTLEEFKVPAKVIQVTRGPAVTRYELQMPPGISVKRIEPFEQDLSYRLASRRGVRIETPIPGKTAVGIEVPNDTIATVGLKEILESKEYVSAPAPLTFALGKDIGGDMIVCNLAKMPHLLIAGATGSGKSACLNSLIVSMIYKTSPDDLRLILIDPKHVEFSNYAGLPHLMLPEVVTDCEKAVNAFNWAINEMERRYMLFNSLRVRNVGDYNACDAVKSGQEAKIPYIVIIVDELADLMLSDKRGVEDRIRNLAQKARAAGIHLVLATQRPSVDVITGTIKANLPSRIAFAVTNFMDSKTILDQGGADKLLGRGDMLYAPMEAPEPKRIQGAYVTGDEVNAILEYVRDNNPCVYDESVSQMINSVKGPDAGEPAPDDAEAADEDPLLGEAVKLVIENGQASISMVQRRFCVGYARAARLIDQMELRKYISPFEGSKPRQVFLTMDEWRSIFGQ